MSAKRGARMEMLKKMKEKMKGEMSKGYKDKMGDKLSSVKVVASEEKMPKALSIAEKLMSAKKGSKYKDGGYSKQGVLTDSDTKRYKSKDPGILTDSDTKRYKGDDKEDYKKKLMKSYKKKS